MCCIYEPLLKSEACNVTVLPKPISGIRRSMETPWIKAAEAESRFSVTLMMKPGEAKQGKTSIWSNTLNNSMF